MIRITSFRATRFLFVGLLSASLLYLSFCLALPKLGASVPNSSSYSKTIFETGTSAKYHLSSPAKPSSSLTTNQGQCQTCAQRGDQVIYSPLIDLNEAKGCEIVFNSRSPHEIEVTPTFYKTNGTPIVGDPVRVQSLEMRFVDLKKLIPGKYRNDRDWGGMSLAYTGAPREIWAQLKLLRINGGGSVDAFFAVPQESRSNAQESVWWMPENSTAIIALGNINDTTTSAMVTFGGGQTQYVTLAPHATEVIRHQHTSSAGSKSVTININGPAGSVIPTGIIASADGEFNSVIRFYDPKAAKQPHLFGNGLRLKGATPRMVLKNTTLETITATPKFIPHAGIKAGRPVILPALTLGPGEVIEANLSQLAGTVKNRNDLNTVSVEIQSNGTPGSLIGALYSTDENARITYDVPLRDSGPANRSQGSYPVRIEGDYTTVVSITNVSEALAKFTIAINYQGGRYFPKMQELKVGETVVFDLKKMRDERTPDGLGNILPPAIMKGQFQWSVSNATEGAILIGRSEVVSLTSRASSSFSCPMYCSDSYSRGELRTQIAQESTLDLSDGDTEIVEGWEWKMSGYGVESGPYFPVVLTRLDQSCCVEVPVVSTDSSNGAVTGVEGGDGFVCGYWNSDSYEGEEPFCVPRVVQGSGSLVVRVTKIRIRKPNGSDITCLPSNCPTTDVIVGQQISLRIDVHPPGRVLQDPQWTIPGRTLSNYVANSSSSTFTQLTNLAVKDIDYYWYDNGNRTVNFSVQIGGKTGTRQTKFNVVRPTVDSLTVSKASVTADANYDEPGDWLHYGNPLTTPGIKFSLSTIGIPSGFAGEIAWVNIADAVFRRRLNTLGGWERLVQFGIDGPFPYAGNVISTSDSPAAALNITFSRREVADNFNMYLIFKPSIPGTNTIWVPLRRINWGWQGVAIRSGFSWSLSGPTYNPHIINDDFNFPTWSRAIDLNAWVPE